MPPKVKVTKENILATALEIVRTSGADALNARRVAQKLGCSTQPIFSNYASMKELRQAVTDEAYGIYRGYAEREAASGEFPLYKAGGMGYIRFAQEEKKLFKLLYMRDRTKEPFTEPPTESEKLMATVRENTGLPEDKAALFHLEMWTFVHGIAAMLATDYLTLDRELISRMMTDAYRGIKMRFEEADDSDL